MTEQAHSQSCAAPSVLRASDSIHFMASFTPTQHSFSHLQFGILLPLCGNCEWHSGNISCGISLVEEQTRFILDVKKVVTCTSLASQVIFKFLSIVKSRI